MSEFIDAAKGIIDAWKRTDIEGVLSFLHEEIEYHYLIGERPLVGKDWVRRFLEKFGRGQTNIKWRIVSHAVSESESDSRLMVEGIDEYTDQDGLHIMVPYMGVFEFEDGKIRRWRDYLDTNLLAIAKRGEPNSTWLNTFLNQLETGET